MQRRAAAHLRGGCGGGAGRPGDQAVPRHGNTGFGSTPRRSLQVEVFESDRRKMEDLKPLGGK